MGFPYIPRHILPKGGHRLRAEEFDGCLCIRAQPETSAYLNPYGCCLIDLVVDSRMFKESERKSNTANTTPDDGELNTSWA